MGGRASLMRSKVKSSTNSIADKIRKILTTQPAKRRERDHDMLAKTLMSCQLFHERKDLAGYDIRDLTNALKFEQVGRGERAYTYGDSGDMFYIIVKGLVSVRAPNVD